MQLPWHVFSFMDGTCSTSAVIGQKWIVKRTEIINCKDECKGNRIGLQAGWDNHMYFARMNHESIGESFDFMLVNHSLFTAVPLLFPSFVVLLIIQAMNDYDFCCRLL